MKKNNSDHHSHHDGHNSSHEASPHSPQTHPSPPPTPSVSHQHHPSPTSPHLGHHAYHIQEFKKRFWLSLLLTVPILLFSEMIQSWFQFRLVIPYQKLVLFFLSSVIYFYGGWPFLKGAAKELKNRQPGMMTLIATAITVAFGYSTGTVFFLAGKDFFWELATLIDVMLLGHWIEARSVLGASRALEELVKIMPTVAHLYREEKIIDIPVAELKAGDIVLVRPGEKIPSDGKIIEGESYLNESLLTGESKPVFKTVEDKVIGGAINGESALKVLIERTGEETYLAQVIKLVEQAQASKSKTQDLANRAAALLFYVALGGGLITYTVWSLLRRPDFALERTVTVLVIACPHALGLAIPLVVALSTSITAKSGTLIRDRRAFERIKDITAVVFDKTGTLTEGQFGVTDVVAFVPEKELIRLTAGVEVNSEHIIARAIVDYAGQKEIEIPAVEESRILPGKGILGRIEGRQILVGGPNLLKEKGLEIRDDRIKKLQSQGKTVIFTLEGNQLLGAFALADKIRPESAVAIQELKAKGITVFMLTGDAEEVAEAVAGELGIDDYFARVLPEEKADKIKLLKEKGYQVAMVGDGINVLQPW